MYRITFALDLFNGPKERKLSDATLGVMLDCLAKIDELYLATHPNAPLLYESGVRYMEEPPGQEDWQDVPTTIRLGIGDCLPLSAMVLREDETLATIGSLKPGDRILDAQGEPDTILAAAVTGAKTILAVQLSNGRTLRCSTQHRLFLSPVHGGAEVRAEDVRIGDELLSPGLTPVRAQSIAEEPHTALCGDLTTDSGRIYLPEPDVIVHNCEDLACWRAAELRVRYRVDARPIFKRTERPDGGILYHILVHYPAGSARGMTLPPFTTRTRDGQIEEDPSKALGMR